jgi:uncharacterized protein (TIGR03382 family)
MIIREVGQLSDGSPIDYALVRLGRPFSQIEAAVVVSAATILTGDRMSSFGFPLGVPLKVDPNGRVLATDRTGFRLSTDTYIGNSGSGIYDDMGFLAGILMTGQRDFEWDEVRHCNASRVLTSEENGAGERAMAAEVALARACHQRPELELCPPVDEPRSSTTTAASDPQPLDDPAAKGAHEASASRLPKNATHALEEHAQAFDAGAEDQPWARAIHRPAGRSSGGCAAASTHGNSSTTAPLLVCITVLALRRRRMVFGLPAAIRQE